jgi:hypothetical protein
VKRLTPTLLVAVTLLVWAVGAAFAASTSGPDWQNPKLAANPFSNIHNDSYLSDNYRHLGPLASGKPELTQIDKVTFTDPDTGLPKTTVLGECAAQTFDTEGNIVTLCAGLPLPSGGGSWTFNRSVVTIDGAGKVLAYTSFTSSYPDLGIRIGDGHARNNNYYASLAIDPSNEAIWVGTTLGLTKVVP